MANGNGRHTAGTCSECNMPQMARNHYFTGKLLVERDFSDEQRYFVGKDRRHNQQLHGAGTICGLKVVQHPNPACRDQYVIVEPGAAIDCCGREVLVPHAEHFDVAARLREVWQKQHGKGTTPDGEPHTLQICLRYVECPAEEVPALFDECGCDDTACQPNRVIERYEFDLLLDPPPRPDDPIGVRLEWRNTINLADARFVALHEATQRLYVLAGARPAQLYAVSTANHAIVASRAFADLSPVDLAVSPDGTRIYAALAKTATEMQIQVLDAGDLSQEPINTLSPPSFERDMMAIAPDGRLYVANRSGKEVLVFNPAAPPPANPTAILLEVSPDTLVAAPDGGFIYVTHLSDSSSSIIAIRTSDANVTTLPLTSIRPGIQPVSLAVVSTTAGDNLAVVNNENRKIHLIGHRPGAAPAVMPLGDAISGLAHPPVLATFAPGGAWLYVLEEDRSSDPANPKVYTQPIDVQRVAQQLPDALGAAEPIGVKGFDIVLLASQRRMYVAYRGKSEPTDPGGVAIVEVIEEPCADLFNQALDGCPACDQGDCVVLATIKNYVAGNPIADEAIDNLADRTLLPSTALLAEVVQCLLERGGGGAGERGPQGRPGKEGAKGDPGRTILSGKEEPGDTIGARDDFYLQIDTADPSKDILLYGPKTDRWDAGIPLKGLRGDRGLSIDRVEVVETLDHDKPAKAEQVLGPGGTRVVNLHLPRGNPGLGIDKVVVNQIDCDVSRTGPKIQEKVLSGGKLERTLVFDVNRGCDAKPLPLPHVVGINWTHDGVIAGAARATLNKNGLIIAFDQPMKAETINDRTFQVLFRKEEANPDLPFATFCYCNIKGNVSAINVGASCTAPFPTTVDLTPVLPGQPALAARFVPLNPSEEETDWANGEYIVLLKGDFILGETTIKLPDGREVNPALDANHLGPGLPSRCPSGDVVEGGTFESWFRLVS